MYPLEEPDDLSDCDPVTRTDVSAVLDVTVVPVSPSSVVTEFCDVFPCCSDWSWLNCSPPLSPRSVLSFGQFHKKRCGMKVHQS